MVVYLDYNASAPIDLRVLDTMVDVYKNKIGNAESRTHSQGNAVREIVEEARKQVAKLLAVDEKEVFFTSGATESNNIAIQGLQQYAEKTGKKHIITSAIEHKAILETCKAMEKRGFQISIVNPGLNGRVNENEVLSLVRADTLLVSIMHVNNETGTIQPVDKIGDKLYDTGTLFHIDATQSCGKLVNEIQGLKYDMLSFSAHKLRGPQGIGCLVLRRKGYRLPPVGPIMYGGPQEHGISPGTVPAALVAGCGKACELALVEHESNSKKNLMIRDDITGILDNSKLNYQINGDIDYCISNTLNISICGVSAEALMIASKQYCSISNGSACTSTSYDPSYVLSAMGLQNEQIESSVRISWGADEKIEDVHKGVAKLVSVAEKLVL